jgi:hypothetical protein
VLIGLVRLFYGRGDASPRQGLSAYDGLPPDAEQPTRRTLLDCPAHVIIERSSR